MCCRPRRFDSCMVSPAKVISQMLPFLRNAFFTSLAVVILPVETLLRRSGTIPGIKDSSQMKMALEELVEAGWIRAAPTRKGGGAGQQKSDFEINPCVREIVK